MSPVVNVHEAKTHFSRLLEEAHAGQEIIVAKAGKPYARLMPLALEQSGRRPGRLPGTVGEEFFEPLPPEELAAGPGLMRLLLDTHALLWWFTDDRQLSARARELIGDESNEVFVSAASAWEIATKHRLGKLDDAPQAADRFPELVAADGFGHLPVTYRHCLRAGGNQVEHRDPFDRMLASQSELEALHLVTRDPAFGQFGTRTTW